MKKEQLFDAVGRTEDALLVRSEKSHRAALWIKTAVAVAAALALTVGLVAILSRTAPTEALPMIEMETYYPNGGGGHGCSDTYPVEPVNVSKKLTVYQNHSYNSEGVLYGLSAAEAEDIILKAADTADLQISPIRYDLFETAFSYHLGNPGEEFPPGDTLYQAVMNSEDGFISVSGDGSFRIKFSKVDADSPDEFIPLSDEDWIAKARALYGQYPQLVFDTPQFSVIHGENTVYVYISEGNPTEYHLRSAVFWFSQNGNLEKLQYNNEKMDVEKLGDYPTITPETAKALLLNGQFNETLSGGWLIDYRDITEERLAGYGFTYQSTVADRFFIPYYTFYVDLAGTDYATASTYAVFYVPAIEGRYVKGFLSESADGTIPTARPITTKPTAPTRYPAGTAVSRRTLPTTTAKPAVLSSITLTQVPSSETGDAPAGTPITFEKVYGNRLQYFDTPTYQVIADAATYQQIPWESFSGNHPAYDDAFFEDKALIRLDVVLPDPSYSKTVTKLYRNGDVLEVVVVTLHETDATVPSVVVPCTTVLSVDRSTLAGITKIAFYTDNQV